MREPKNGAANKNDPSRRDRSKKSNMAPKTMLSDVAGMPAKLSEINGSTQVIILQYVQKCIQKMIPIPSSCKLKKMRVRAALLLIWEQSLVSSHLLR